MNTIEFQNQLNEILKNITKDNIRFMIFETKDYESLKNILSEILLEPLYVQGKTNLLVIYFNKDRVGINEYIDSLSDDIGTSVNVFEGFVIKNRNKSDLKEFMEIFYSSSFNLYGYSNIVDLVHGLRYDKENINSLKEILLKEYLGDEEFLKIVRGMFENNLNVSKTSSSIYMHRNTLNNKLTLIENNTTLAIQNFKDAVALYELLK